MSVPTVLEKIIARKLEEVAERSRRIGLAEAGAAGRDRRPGARLRGGARAARERQGASGDRRSEEGLAGKGVIRDPFLPAEIAAGYEAGELPVCRC